MPMTSFISTLFMFSVLLPAKLWFAPGQPIAIDVKTDAPVTLVMTDFAGKPFPAASSAAVSGRIDLTKIYSTLSIGTYVLYAVPQGKQLPTFVGTPLVIEQRSDTRPGAPQGVLVTRIEPLRYAVMDTDAGAMTMAFYYDSAPNTVNNFLTLANEGFYDGIAFHRIVSGFVLQAGDPLSMDPERAGSGGPGFTVNAEFNDRPHERGVLSMARQGDAGERQGNPPGYEAANSGSSQFFICLDYARTKALDKKYTAFGKVVDGDATIEKLAALPVQPGDRPVNPPVIKSVVVKTVTPGDNPYEKLK